jgi:hypothetical protein
VLAIVTLKIGLIAISPILGVTELIRMIREAKESDARLLLELLTNLDKETNFMSLYRFTGHDLFRLAADISK